MSDQETKTEVVEGTTTETVASGEEVEVPAVPVVVQEGALVGDEEVYAEEHVHKVEPEVTQGETTQKYAPATEQQAVYPVHETNIALDTVITDPTSPEAVQIPDAGRGSNVLPLHSLTEPAPEAAFREAGSTEVDFTDEDRAKAAAEGRSLNEVANDKS